MWSGQIHQQYPFIPSWVPSHESIVSATLSVKDNVLANVQAEGKDKKEMAIEVSLVFVQVVAFLFAILGVPPFMRPPFFIFQICGVALAVVGIFYFLASGATLASKLSVLPTPSPSAMLVTEGVFAHCRHPQYFGMVAFTLGLSMLTVSVHRLFYVVLLWIALEKLADIEELCLLEKFPEYADYMKDKPKFIPGRLVGGGAAPPSPGREGFVVLEDARVAE